MDINTLRTLEDIPLTIEQWGILSLISQGVKASDLPNIYWRASQPINDLIALGFVEGDKITSSGSLILETVKDKADINKKEFDKFWQAYPKDDEWAHYPKTRFIRSGKKSAQHAFSIKKNPLHEILEGLGNYIEFLKNSSTAQNNGLKYMVSPTKFLEDELYLDFKRDREDNQSAKLQNLL